MTENEINFTATYIASIAKEDNAIDKVNIALQSLLSTYQKEANVSMGKRNNFTPVTSIIKFTQKEISNMEKKFKKIFIANGLVATVRIRKSGYYQTTYEIRFRSQGYNISCTSKDLNVAKAEFIRKTKPGEIDNHKIKQSQRKCKHQLHVYFNEWLSLNSAFIFTFTFKVL